jgi:hypothetical protein
MFAVDREREWRGAAERDHHLVEIMLRSGRFAEGDCGRRAVGRGAWAVSQHLERHAGSGGGGSDALQGPGVLNSTRIASIRPVAWCTSTRIIEELLSSRHDSGNFWGVATQCQRPGLVEAGMTGSAYRW